MEQIMYTDLEAIEGRRKYSQDIYVCIQIGPGKPFTC